VAADYLDEDSIVALLNRKGDDADYTALRMRSENRGIVPANRYLDGGTSSGVVSFP
jgi:hypothetical protein